MQSLKNIRDFLDEEQMKWLPNNLLVENCILLTQNKKDNKGVHTVVLQVFDRTGIWIGEITHPDWIPKK